MTTELQKQVALALGWTITDLNDNPNGMRVKGPNWVVRDPDGNNKGRGFKAESAWGETITPQWDTDTDTALLLPLNSDSWFELVTPGWQATEYGCRVLEHDVPKVYPAPLLIHNHRFETASKPAEAVCKAWLAWKRIKQREALSE